VCNKYIILYASVILIVIKPRPFAILTFIKARPSVILIVTFDLLTPKVDRFIMPLPEDYSCRFASKSVH